jgi:uncharacterized protein (TIGR03000 family)
MSIGTTALLACMSWLLLAPGNAEAQRFGRRGFGGYGYGGYGGYGYYPYSGYGYAPYGGYAYTVPGPYNHVPYNMYSGPYQGNTIVQPRSYNSYYQPNGNYVDSSTGDRAQITVRVPRPDAQVWFEGQQTQQTGMQRTFSSPPLERGYQYSYNIRARWRQGDRDMDQTRTINVQPGQTSTVDFSTQQ